MKKNERFLTGRRLRSNLTGDSDMDVDGYRPRYTKRREGAIEHA